MRPQKVNQQTTTAVLKKGIITRSKKVANTTMNEGKEREVPKRKADRSPAKHSLKRSAFGDITNALGHNITSQNIKNLPKKVIASKPVRTTKGAVTAVAVPSKSTAVQPVPKTFRTLKKSTISTNHIGTATQKSEEINTELSTSSVPAKEIKGHICEFSEPRQNVSSGRDTSSDSSLYVSALEDIPSDGSSSQGEPQVPALAVPGPATTLAVTVPTSNAEPELPENVDDFDKETLNDPFQVSLYAMDIFNYLKEKEVLFKVDNYMEKQPSISEWMRSLLVDWMVEVQESFELNHETLYLAVKLVDIYLMKVVVSKETLQLIGAAAMFIACKYDERIPPQVGDFLYICDGAYTHRELIRMETNVLKVIDFKLGIPLSYRFLRRYARCAKLSLQTLTFARYILELSLIEYNFVSESSSKIAAAALFLALKTKFLGGWTPTLQYYTGYKLEDIRDLAQQLNAMLHKKPKSALQTVRNKYSHKIFFEVAKIPLLEKLDM